MFEMKRGVATKTHATQDHPRFFKPAYLVHKCVEKRAWVNCFGIHVKRAKQRSDCTFPVPSIGPAAVPLHQALHSRRCVP